MDGKAKVGFVLATVLAGLLLIVTSAAALAGTRSEGIFVMNEFDGTWTECGYLLNVAGGGGDDQFGPFLVEMELCLDFTNWPQYRVTNPSGIIMAANKCGDPCLKSYDILEFTCEDYDYIDDTETCLGKLLDGDVRCWINEGSGTGRFEGARGFLDYNIVVGLAESCLGYPDGDPESDVFPFGYWYEMHLKFPQGPKE